jgi:cytochrome b561
MLLLQPILGLLHTNAQGRRVDLYFLGELPAVVRPDRALAKQAMAAHELIACALLALIALHAGAALFHHFVRRDNVLNAMLPGRSCRGSSPASPGRIIRMPGSIPLARRDEAS